MASPRRPQPTRGEAKSSPEHETKNLLNGDFLFAYSMRKPNFVSRLSRDDSHFSLLALLQESNELTFPELRLAAPGKLHSLQS